MENIISYYYNLDITNYQEQKEAIIIEANNKVFIAKIIKDIELFKKVLSLIMNIPNDYYKPLGTRDNNYFFEYNSKQYVLFELINPSYDRKDNFLFISVTGDAIDYSSIWENNMKYYSQLLPSKGQESLEEADFLNYYIGMGENAIAVNEIANSIKGNARVVIGHYRIKYPNYNLTYNDPTELYIDYISRDLSEYIKTKFFEIGITIDEVLALINKFNLNDKELMYLYARLLYPNYYFDFINEKEELRSKYKKKRKDYEKLLSGIFRQIKTTLTAVNIQWLNQKL